jgi:hypothetical protein
MTPTEVLKEIRKMPRSAKEEILRELSEVPTEPELDGYSKKEKEFIKSMRRQGLISHVPPRNPDTYKRRSFKRINVTGEPMSETIIRERR